MSTIAVKKLRFDAIIPTRGSKDAAGLDLYAVDYITIPAGGRVLVPTGISISIPKNTYFRIAPRSGLAYKSGIDVLAGVIDSDYRGEIKVLLINLSKDVFSIARGDRIAQGILELIDIPEVIEVESLDDTDRGSGGFGSTGV
jgi:dUTP pyrophosphatase